MHQVVHGEGPVDVNIWRGWCLPWTSDSALAWNLKDYDIDVDDFMSPGFQPERARLPKIHHPEWVGQDAQKEEYAYLMQLRNSLGLRLFSEPQTPMPVEMADVATIQYVLRSLRKAKHLHLTLQ